MRSTHRCRPPLQFLRLGQQSLFLGKSEAQILRFFAKLGSYIQKALREFYGWRA